MKRGQIKIQEMAFVLVGIFIFFALAALFYFGIRYSGLKEDARTLRAEQAKEMVIKIPSSPEFSWGGCLNCIDMDKALILKERKGYQGFWGLDYLQLERVHPNSTNVECTRANYPNCNRITVVNKTQNFGTPAWQFVALCRYNNEKGGYTGCELGKIYAAGKSIEG